MSITRAALKKLGDSLGGPPPAGQGQSAGHDRPAGQDRQ